jgi:CHAT domain-containing protein
VTADAVTAVALDVTPRSIHATLSDIGSPWRDGGEADPAFSLVGLHTLYRELWQPLEHLIKTPSVLVIPDAVTSTIPFAALTSEVGESYESAPYLLNDYSIGYDVSASLLSNSTQGSRFDSQPLLMGLETFQGSMWNTSLPNLEHVRDELRGIGRAVGGTTLIGDDASETAFYERARGASVIHIASHAEANSAFPLSSRIELSRDDEEDGTLHLYEIIETTLQADVVVLSGCSTGDGQAVAGEGIIGLQYGMRASGASSTVATLWPLGDESAATLMATFYQGLADGLRKDQAMRRAQLEYVRSTSGISASPFFWASPIVSGDMSALYQPARVKWPVMAAAIAALILGIAWVFYRSHKNVRLARPV